MGWIMGITNSMSASRSSQDQGEVYSGPFTNHTSQTYTATDLITEYVLRTEFTRSSTEYSVLYSIPIIYSLPKLLINII